MSLVWSYQFPKNHLAKMCFEVYNERPALNFLEVTQTHSNIICHKADIPCCADGILLSPQENFPIAIKTADCLPIALLGERGSALIHAGWRGLQSKILHDSKICELKPLWAVIGPYINPLNYEVGEDVFEAFSSKQYFQKKICSNKENKWFFDLGAEASSQLLKLAPDLKITLSPLYTFSDLSLHSFRKNKTEKRNYNILRQN